MCSFKDLARLDLSLCTCISMYILWQHYYTASLFWNISIWHCFGMQVFNYKKHLSWTAVQLLSLIEYSAVCYSDVFVYLNYAVLLVFSKIYVEKNALSAVKKEKKLKKHWSVSHEIKIFHQTVINDFFGGVRGEIFMPHDLYCSVFRYRKRNWRSCVNVSAHQVYRNGVETIYKTSCAPWQSSKMT